MDFQTIKNEILKSPDGEKLLQIAFTHRSYASENHLDYDNQRLEFLGDAVLELIEELNDRLVDLRVRLDVAQKAKVDGKGRGEELLKEIAEYREAEEKLRLDVARCEKNTAACREKIEAAEKDLTDASAELVDVELDKEAEIKHIT